MKLPRGGRVPHVVLVGLPGAGKSSVGRDVARRTRRPFVDLDEVIEHSFGATVTEIFARWGEGKFRAAEAEASERVARGPAAVIAPGGGWMTNSDAVAHLRESSRIVYLRVTPEVALQRMGTGVGRRPLLAGGDPLARVRALHAARRAGYEAVADAIVDTDALDRREVVSRVVALLVDAAAPLERA